MRMMTDVLLAKTGGEAVLLRQEEVRRRMNEALLREATGESKSTGVIRAYELVQKILSEAGEDAPPDQWDLRRFSDRQLRDMIARWERTEMSPAEDGKSVTNGGETGTDGGEAHEK